MIIQPKEVILLMDDSIKLSDLETANKKDTSKAYLDSSAVADSDDGDGVILELTDSEEENPVELGVKPALAMGMDEAA